MLFYFFVVSSLQSAGVMLHLYQGAVGGLVTFFESAVQLQTRTKFMRQHADISHSVKIGQCLLCIQNIQYQSPSSNSLFSCKLH